PRSRRSSTTKGLINPALISSMKERFHWRLKPETEDLLGARWRGRPEIKGGQLEKEAQPQKETSQNAGGLAPPPCRKKREREIPSMGQGPFGGSICGQCLSPFFRKE